ncbi:toll/interleukin-1 receptor domain-containing protein [Bacillus atrophaeus]|uniref:toll/interleukin-1 receptor domain-containing protein n=1 Tax=Bacillus atrophaeus TaxID=1452 RepID=UPI00255B5FE6|nr:toll/interleukin-1 receptor domain-containing protein [Bacillus atrophaeus]MDL5143111.1 toll/interleukin-1 receptor domain-containing protein [Bacillus atrophaeus]
MKVFLSWSGKLSKDVATEFSRWIPQVLQFVKPFLSSEDIEKGSRWGHEIAKNLEESTHGVFFVTKDNIGAPWINFEAGALSKSLENSHVWTLLINMNNSDLNEGPLRQFQTTLFSKNDVKSLVKDINSANGENGLDDNIVEMSFEKWWPDLENSINELILKYKGDAQQNIQPKEPQNTSNEILEEILGSVRNQERLLRDPEQLLPAGYVRHVIRNTMGTSSPISPAAIKELRFAEESLLIICRELRLKETENVVLEKLYDEILNITTRLNEVTNYIEKKGLRQERIRYKNKLSGLEE